MLGDVLCVCVMCYVLRIITTIVIIITSIGSIIKYYYC